MRRLPSFGLVGLALVLSSCAASKPEKPGPQPLSGPIRIELDLKDPSKSFGVLPLGNDRTIFKVGYGRLGVTCAGSRFEEGYTPLGRFKVNAILSNDRFEMEPALIKQSGKSEDFSGDGEVGEYGIGYVSLVPLNSVKQPFKFNTYDGKFRWYSFAIHGSNNDQRIGQKVTGGCVNVAEPVLKTLLSSVQLGDEVEVTANGPCTP